MPTKLRRFMISLPDNLYSTLNKDRKSIAMSTWIVRIVEIYYESHKEDAILPPRRKVDEAVSPSFKATVPENKKPSGELSKEQLEIRLLAAKEVMNLLKVSRSALYTITFQPQNPLPSVKIGKSRRYPNDKVRQWMENLHQ